MAEDDGDLDRFMRRVEHLSDGELLAIVAVGERQDRVSERIALHSAERIAEGAGLAADLDRARDAIISWSTSQGPWAGQLSGFAMPEPIVGNLRRRAAPELINAAFAIALGDRLPDEVADPLLHAWRSTVEPGGGAG
jgi:hypothetical protein